MKKMFLTVLMALALLFCTASASADLVLPKGTTDIADEAFLNAKLSYYLTIPDGVKTIGHQAFAGSSAVQVKLPASLTYIALDAFSPNASFEVLPGSYARQWCIDNDYFYDEMRVFVNTEAIVSYADKPAVLKAKCSYPEQVDFYRWETSSNLMTWQAVPDQTGSSIQVSYVDNLKVSYVRCRASVNGVLLEPANYATVTYKPGTVQFSTEKSKALSGDAIYLEWTDMGTGMQYYLSQWIPDASLENGGRWQTIESRLTFNSYTVYGLEKNTEYNFIVIAMPAQDDGRDLRYETEPFSCTTLEDPYSFKITGSRVEGVSFYAEWERVDGAYYLIEYLQEGRDPSVLVANWEGTNVWIYGIPRNTDFSVRLTAWVPDKRYESNRYNIASALANARSGDYDPAITLNDVTVANGIVHLSWNALGGTVYTVYMSLDGGQTSTPIASGLEVTYYDVNGLEPGKQYSFKVTAVSGSWNNSTEWSSITVPEKNSANVEYRALLIGEVSFKGRQRAERNYGDVELIASALETAKGPNGSLYSVVRRKDLNADQILDAISDTFSGADENDVSLFFIGTHGDISDIGQDAGYIQTVDPNGTQGYLDLYVLADLLSRVKGKVIVWLGSCGSGAGIYEQGVPQNGDALTSVAMQAFSACDSVTEVPADGLGGTGEFRKAGKFYVLTAARYHEMSWGLESMHYNFFGKFLSEGITVANGMPADANADGKVTQHELFLYIKAREENKENFVYQNVQEYPLNSEYVLFVQ